MESKSVVALIILLLSIDVGSAGVASSYSNHYNGLGYEYPQRFGSNELSEEALNKLFNHLRQGHEERIEANGFRETIFVEHNEDEPEFSYDENDRYGPSRWNELASVCAGMNQSPIAINVRNVTIREDAEPFDIDGLDILPESINVKNNGHSLSLVFKYPNDTKIRFSGGPLQNEFYLDNIHFHWGMNNSGSEHVINDKRYAAEMHLVTYNSMFGSIANAILEPTGLAVLGILFEYDKNFASKDHPWSKFASKVTKAHSSYTETNWIFPLRDIIKETEFRGLLSYQGSLTTPGCSENVLWMLSTRPILIKQNELYELRRLRDGKGRRLLRNFRPVQEVNGRVITAFKYY